MTFLLINWSKYHVISYVKLIRESTFQYFIQKNDITALAFHASVRTLATADAANSSTRDSPVH